MLAILHMFRQLLSMPGHGPKVRAALHWRKASRAVLMAIHAHRR